MKRVNLDAVGRSHRDRLSRSGRAIATCAVVGLAFSVISVATLPDKSLAAAPRSMTVVAAPRHWDVTLVTGDRVRVMEDSQHRFSAAIVGGSANGEARITGVGNHLYVVPSHVESMVGPVLDPALFDVRGLVAEGFDDATTGQVPVIVAQEGNEDAARLEASTTQALDARTVLHRSGLVAATVEKVRAHHLGRQLVARARSTSAKASPSGVGLQGVSRMWLDRPVRVDWDPNLEQIGAPAVWASGDGTGVRVAVLDTGIDATHPDLAGKVVASRDFTGKGNVLDGHGHGTHVAGTAVGTGGGNEGLRKGVAPGASLLVGKVLNDSGGGATSWVIGGMEWAVEQGADVVNMSLGAAPTDGTDPQSQAVNRLTEQGTLFVISAGNRGPGAETIGSPGAADAALTVAAADATDAVAAFSSRGPRMGDGALKPDVSAPGVSIVAARANGTSMGTPVDGRYTAASGTSMAAPHVAGEAALVLQRHPDWTPEQVKAALAATADPVAGTSPLAQGAGRIDVAEALAATVFPDDEDVDLGTILWPQPAVSTAHVGWRNEGTSDVTLDFTLELRDPSGNAVPSTRAWLSEPRLTIPAGGRGQVAVNVNARDTATGLHVGYLTESIAGIPEQLRLPVGFVDEEETYNLTVRGITRAGGPAADSTMRLFNVDDGREVFQTFYTFGPDGTVRLRVPRGNYYVASAITEQDNLNPVQLTGEADAVSMLSAPQVSVTQPTTVTLDARTAVRSATRVAGVDAVPEESVLTEIRRDSRDQAIVFSAIVTGETPTYVRPNAAAPTIGTLRTELSRRMVERPVELRTTGPKGRSLRATWTHNSFHSEVERQRLAAIDLGAGTQAEFDSATVAGRIAVVRRGLPVPELAARAKASRAAVLAITNDRAGVFGATALPTYGMPVVIVDGNDAAALRTAAARGDRVVYALRPYFDVTYDLHETGVGNYPQPATRTYTRADVAKLARVDAVYPQGKLTERFELTTRFATPGGSVHSLDSNGAIGRPHRIEYVTPGYDYSKWFAYIPPDRQYVALAFGTWRRLAPAERATDSWFRAPLHTKIGIMGNSVPIRRSADSLSVGMAGLADGDGHHAATLNADGGSDVVNSISLYRGNTLVSHQPNTLLATLPMAAEPARYRLVTTHDTNGLTPIRTRTTNSWEFDSARPTSGSVPLPLPEIDYDLDIDSAGRLAGRDLRVNVVPQPWAPSLTVRHVVVDYSTDDGATWRLLRQASAPEGNSLTARLPAVRGQHLSLRTVLTTGADVTHMQTIVRAVALR